MIGPIIGSLHQHFYLSVPFLHSFAGFGQKCHTFNLKLRKPFFSTVVSLFTKTVWEIEFFWSLFAMNFGKAKFCSIFAINFQEVKVTWKVNYVLKLRCHCSRVVPTKRNAVKRHQLLQSEQPNIQTRKQTNKQIYIQTKNTKNKLNKQTIYLHTPNRNLVCNIWLLVRERCKKKRKTKLTSV